MNTIQALIEAEKKASCVSTVGYAALNAMPDIIEQDRKYRELVGLCRGIVVSGKSVAMKRDTLKRIREIVSE